MNSEKKFYITTPLYYVNDKPHIGHAYTTILADVINRFFKLFGYKTYFLTGTDEHGQKVQQASAKSNKDPKKYCDELSVVFKNLWEKLNIEYDYFIRTTDDDHVKVVQNSLMKLYENGDIYPADYDGWYCIPCERFWTEKDLIDGKCPDCNREVQKISEKNYFFKMSKYQNWLIDHIKNTPDFVVPEFRKNEVLGFLRQPLNDLCISRPKSRLSWGIPLPFDENYVCYVWFDALLNYITGAGYLFNNEKFNLTWPADYHLIGKDILTTHAVYWPIMLKALDVEPPRHILAHGWWLIDNDKMSKSKGNVVKPLELIDKYGVDAFRYFLMREMSLGHDANFSEESMIDRINSDLANDLGNLLNRINKMVFNYLDGLIKKPASLEEIDKNLLSFSLNLLNKIPNLLEELKLNIIIEESLTVVRSINKYLEQTAPWKLAKEKNQTERINQILYTASVSILKSALFLYPIMPEKIKILLNSFGISNINSVKDSFTFIDSLEKINLSKIDALFPRIDKKEIFYENKQEKVQEEDDNLISIEDVAKLDLKVAKIIKAEKIKKSDKLLKLQVEVGNKTKQIVAGIGKYYNPDELIGKTIVIVNNLKPAKLMGEISEGMLLAAKEKKGNLSLLTVDKNVKSGSKIS